VNCTERRRRGPTLREFQVDTTGEWADQIFMSVLRILGIIHAPAAKLRAGTALEGGEQASTPGVDHEVDGSVGRFQEGFDELKPSAFFPAGHDSRPLRPRTPARSHSPRTVGPAQVRAFPAGSIETRGRPIPMPQRSRVFSRLS
jgi:hypothetical protein